MLHQAWELQLGHNVSSPASPSDDNFSMKLTQATLSIRNISGTFKEKIVSDHILGVKDY